VARPTTRDVHQDAALSNVSIAYRNESYIGIQCFPRVTVENQSDSFYVFDKGAWFRVANRSRRAPGVAAARVDYTLSTGSYLCVEHSLAHGVPDEVRRNADNALNPEVSAVEFVTDSLLRIQEYRLATLISTNGSTNWATNSSPATTWDDDSSDPLGDIEGGRQSVTKLIGRAPNTLVFGAETWSKLKHHPDLMDRIKYTSRGLLTVPIAQELFEVERILIGSAVRDSAMEGEDSSMGYVWGKQAILMYTPPSPGLMIPAAGYAFEWIPFQTERYREDQEKQDVFAVAHSVDERITGSDAGVVFHKCIA